MRGLEQPRPGRHTLLRFRKKADVQWCVPFLEKRCDCRKADREYRKQKNVAYFHHQSELFRGDPPMVYHGEKEKTAGKIQKPEEQIY